MLCLQRKKQILGRQLYINKYFKKTKPKLKLFVSYATLMRPDKTETTDRSC